MPRKLDPQKHADRRAAVLNAAIRCFSEKGFHNTSTAEICKAAEMSPGNLFHYFETKAAIIEAIAEADRQEIVRQFAKIDKSIDVIDALETFAEESLRLSVDQTYRQIGLEIVAESGRNPEVARVFQDNDALIRAELVKLFEAGASKSQIAADLDHEATATWMIALTDGAVARAILDPAFQIETHLPTLKRLIRRFLEPA